MMPKNVALKPDSSQKSAFNPHFQEQDLRLYNILQNKEILLFCFFLLPCCLLTEEFPIRVDLHPYPDQTPGFDIVRSCLKIHIRVRLKPSDPHPCVISNKYSITRCSIKVPGIIKEHLFSNFHATYDITNARHIRDSFYACGVVSKSSS